MSFCRVGAVSLIVGTFLTFCYKLCGSFVREGIKWVVSLSYMRVFTTSITTIEFLILFGPLKLDISRFTLVKHINTLTRFTGRTPDASHSGKGDQMFLLHQNVPVSKENYTILI